MRILRTLVPCCRAYCILDAELSDVILFAAPLSAPAAARAARAPPLLRSNTLNFMALQIRVGAYVAEWDPSLKKGDGRCLQQRLPGAEGPPEGFATSPRRLRRSRSRGPGEVILLPLCGLAPARRAALQ